MHSTIQYNIFKQHLQKLCQLETNISTNTITPQTNRYVKDTKQLYD
jgi:hypothetical protein